MGPFLSDNKDKPLNADELSELSDIVTDDAGNVSDVIIETEKITYIFECKLDKSAGEALKQIEDRKYYQQYMQTGKEIGLVGVNFSSQDRNISEWKGSLLSSSGELIREL